jgi:hypothetical protein
MIFDKTKYKHSNYAKYLDLLLRKHLNHQINTIICHIYFLQKLYNAHAKDLLDDSI